MRVARPVTAAWLIPAAIVLAACGDPTTEGEPPADTPPASSTDPTGTGSDVPGTTDPGEGGTAACASADLTVDVTIQDAGLALLALTNGSTTTCQLDGWVTLAFESADRSPVDVAQQQVEQPGPPVATELDPGESAFAGVKWATCDPGSSDCGVAFTVRVGAPGDSATVVARVIGVDGAEVARLLVAELQIGSIQPSTQGVVAW